MQTMMLLAVIPAVAAAGIWALQKPVRMFAAYAAVMPFGSAFALPLGLPRSFTTLSSIVGAAATVTLAWDLARNRRTSPPISTPTTLWLLLLGLAAASVSWSINPAASMDDTYVLGSLVVFYLVVALYPFTSQDLSIVRDGIAAGTGATGAYALVLAATSNLPTTNAGVARFEVTGAGGGEGGDPNITAAALLLGFSVALHSAFQPGISPRRRMFYMLATVLSGAGITLTASRGGLLALIAVVLYTVLTRGSGVVAVLALVTVFASAVLLVPDTLAERMDNTGTTGRSQIWEIALESCPEHCATGSGLGTFPDVHERGVLTIPDATGDKLRFEAHSIWLETLVELGVLGFALLSGALLLLGRELWRLPVQARHGALAGLVALLITSSFLSNALFKYFWLVVMYGTIVVNVSRLHGVKAGTTQRARARRVARLSP